MLVGTSVHQYCAQLTLRIPAQPGAIAVTYLDRAGRGATSEGTAWRGTCTGVLSGRVVLKIAQREIATSSITDRSGS